MPVDRLSGFNMGVSMKVAAQCVATVPITLSGSQNIDGITVGSNSERVLVTAQPNPVDNGVWIANSSSWIRATDCDGARDILPGSLVYVDRGNAFARSMWVFNSSSPASEVIVGRDPLTIVKTIQLFAVTPWVIDNWFNVTSSGMGLERLGGLSSTMLPSELGFNAKTYGAVGDGLTDDTDAMQEAVTAANGDTLFVPAGRYILSDRIVSTGQISIEGSGKAKSEFRWTSDAPAAGLAIYLSSHTECARVSNLSLTTLSSRSTDTALYISATAAIEIGSSFTYSLGFYDRALVESVQISGAAGADSFDYFHDGWGVGINLRNCNNATIRDSNVTGRAETPWAGSTGLVGVLLDGSPSDIYENGHPNAVVCTNNNVNFNDFGWVVDDYEGVYLTNNQTVACNVGFIVSGSSDSMHPQANIINNHFNCRDLGVVIRNQVDCNISDNLIYQIQGSTAYAGIDIDPNAFSYNIGRNVLTSVSSVSDSMNAIVIYGNNGVTSNNVFRQGFNNPIAVGILGGPGSHNNIGRDNLFMGAAGLAGSSGIANLGAASNVFSVTMSSNL